jgi:hypothetical protein
MGREYWIRSSLRKSMKELVDTYRQSYFGQRITKTKIVIPSLRQGSRQEIRA